MTWDTTCLNVSAVDIYLYATDSDKALIQVFENVAFSLGTLQRTLKSKWWNSTASVNMELTIVQAGVPPFLATLPAGPIWQAQYTVPPAGSASPDAGNSSLSDPDVTQVNNLPGAAATRGISKGGVAAAVLVPLIVLGIALGVYVRFTRVREEAKRKRWSAAVDRRMSTISGDWRAMGPGGAEAAVRASFAGPSARNSFAPRPSSTFAAEGAGDDAAGAQMTQIRRPGVGLRGPTPSTAGSERASRISFAADTRFSRASTGEGVATPRTRPSGETRRAGVPSRAFHSAYIPPVPARRSTADAHDGGDGNDSDSNYSASGDGHAARAVSPAQRDGPLALSAADIRARVHGLEAGESAGARPSLDEVMPALSMMRTRNGSQGDLLLEPARPPPALQAAAPAPAPAPAPQEPLSPITDAMPMQPLGAMSPDEMLRVYADRRRMGGGVSAPGTPTIAYPPPVATGPRHPAASNPFHSEADVAPGRRSNETHYENDDAYFGSA